MKTLTFWYTQGALESEFLPYPGIPRDQWDTPLNGHSDSISWIWTWILMPDISLGDDICDKWHHIIYPTGARNQFICWNLLMVKRGVECWPNSSVSQSQRNSPSRKGWMMLSPLLSEGRVYSWVCMAEVCITGLMLIICVSKENAIFKEACAVITQDPTGHMKV